MTNNDIMAKKNEIEKVESAELAAVTTQDVEAHMIMLRNQPVLIDADVAALYGVDTKRVNEAVKNNPQKFPYGYLFELDKYEKKEVVENFDHLNNLKYSKVAPTAFTERGLYMLAVVYSSKDFKSLALLVTTLCKNKQVRADFPTFDKWYRKTHKKVYPITITGRSDEYEDY